MASEPETAAVGGPGEECNAVRDAWTARAEAYAAYAVPKNRPFAVHLVHALAPQPGESVLDVATGPGVVAIEAARAMGDSGRVLATDIAPVWERWVREAAREGGFSSVSFAAMPADALAVPDDSIDVVACQFGLMFVPDPLAALREMRRVLRPRGRLGIAVWSTPDRVAHFVAMTALREALPPEEPVPGERSPLSLSAPGLMEDLVSKAGFVDVEAHRHTETFVLADPEREWERLVGDASFAGKLESIGAEGRSAVRSAVLAALERFRRGDRLEMPSEAIVVTARRPANR